MNEPSKTGAFFDLDGTLLPEPSLEWRFVAFLLERDLISGRNVARWLLEFAKNVLWSPRRAIKENKRYLAGLPESIVTDWENSEAQLRIPFYNEGLARIAWHRAQDHRIFFISGTLAPLALVAARRLWRFAPAHATELDILDGNWTGWLSSEHLSGEAKARTVQRIAERHNLQLSRSFAYGNDLADLAMLETIGVPVATNPSRILERTARARGWDICLWNGAWDKAPRWNPILSSHREAR